MAVIEMQVMSRYYTCTRLRHRPCLRVPPVTKNPPNNITKRVTDGGMRVTRRVKWNITKKVACGVI